MNNELELILKIIFFEYKIKKIEFEGINFDKLIKIASSYLILPTLFSKICRKNYRKYFPDELIVYLEEIYKINKNRNIELLKELNKLSQILQNNKIDHVFIKGSALLLGNYYDDIGERMVGDIDFLFNKKDSVKLEIVLEKNNYLKNEAYPFFEKIHHHMLRRINKNRLFAIEPHISMIKDGLYINTKEVLFEKNKVNGYYVPSEKHILLNNIYAWQINDRGYEKITYSIKNIYDNTLIQKKIKKRVNINITKEIYAYYKIFEALNIKRIINIGDYKNKYVNFRFIIKKQLPILHKLYLFLKYLKRRFVFLPFQLNEIINNEEYRKYSLKKINKRLKINSN